MGGSNSNEQGRHDWRTASARLRKVAWFACALSIALSERSQAQLPAQWQTSVRTALDQRAFTAASRQLDEIFAVEPANLDALRFRAEWFARRGQLTNALAQVERLAAEHPDDRRSALLQAQWLNQLGRSSSALAIYDRWLEHEGGDIDMRVRRALVLRQKGEPAKALAELERTVAAEPDNEFARYSWLRALIGAEHSPEAWRRADEFDRQSGGNDAELGLIKAGMLARLDAPEQAAQLASRPPAEPDQARRQLSFRALLLIRQGRQSEGLALLTPYADLLGDDYDALFDLGNANAAADRLNVARAYFERATSVTPQRPEARMGLARLASREGRLTDSLARYQSILAENPEALEASLGVIRMARLMNDGASARTALAQARQHAPNALDLFREELLLALDVGDIPAFAQVLKRYELAHPGDPVAKLWRMRWHAMETRSVNFAAASQLLDPFSPDVSGGALYLLASTPGIDQVQPLKDWQVDATLPARPELFRALARQMALRLRRDTAERLIKHARASRGAGFGPDPADEVPLMLAAGWWAHVATPFAWAKELSPDFDPQAVHIWLAGEVQRRLRTFAIEAESPLEEEWLLRRAVWFNAWRDKWNTPDAANSLHEYLASMIPDAFENITTAQIADAWRASERWLPPAAVDFNLRITQARWRQERFDFAGSLAIYRELAAEFPEASEPAQRQAVLLRGLGRTSESLAVLRQLTTKPNPNPTTRLEAASLLTRLGEFEAAEHQLALATESGFAEPLIYLSRAELELARGLKDHAEQNIADGLRANPGAASLLSWHAGQLLEARETVSLAALVRSHREASWLTPDLVAAAKPHLTKAEVEAITHSPVWWFQWRWLPWERLEAQSIAALRTASREAVGLGQRERALDTLRPATAARIPDTDLWLAAGRMFDINGESGDAERAYRFAHALGLGRPDAAVAALSRRARQANPDLIAHEFAARLQENPDDFGLRAGLVVALVRAGEVAVAGRALAPLVETAPNDPAVRDLAAQVKGAQGQVREARSLYASILRGDPADTDRRDAQRALRSANQWGFATGYEFSDLRSTTEAPDPADWQEAYAGVFWQQPMRQSWALEYRWFERSNEDASQLRLDYGVGLDEDWLLRAHAAPAAEGDIIPRFKLGGGTSYRVRDPFFATFDFDWLTFSDLDVYQFAPGLSWRWHPRSTVDTRVYFNNNVLNTGTSEWTSTFVLNANWEFASQSAARLSLAVGDESLANPIRDLIGNDSVASIGLSLNLGLGHKWMLVPAWRYERHDRFELNAFGLNAVFSY